MKNLHWLPNHPDTTKWKERHYAALDFPKGFEKPIVRMLQGWIEYAVLHNEQYESPIGEDGLLGVSWAHLGKAIRELLNGDTGRLDCGTLDTILVDNLKEQGFDPDNL